MFTTFKSSFFVALVLLLALASSCVTAELALIDDPENQELEVYTTLLPQQPYKEVAYVKAVGMPFNNAKQLLKKLRKKAKQAGADALVNLKYDYTSTYPYASCTLIRYEEN